MKGLDWVQQNVNLRIIYPSMWFTVQKVKAMSFPVKQVSKPVYETSKPKSTYKNYWKNENLIMQILFNYFWTKKDSNW